MDCWTLNLRPVFWIFTSYFQCIRFQPKTRLFKNISLMVQESWPSWFENFHASSVSQNKSILHGEKLDEVFVIWRIMENNQGWGRGYQPKPKALLKFNYGFAQNVVEDSPKQAKNEIIQEIASFQLVPLFIVRFACLVKRLWDWTGNCESRNKNKQITHPTRITLRNLLLRYCVHAKCQVKKRQRMM